MNTHFFRTVFSGFIIVFLASCSSSDSSRDPITERSTNNLRTYSDGEFIEYTIEGTYKKTTLEVDEQTNDFILIGNDVCTLGKTTQEKTFQGTLRVSWTAVSALPESLLGGDTIDVLQQNVTLDISNIDDADDTFDGIFSAPLTVSFYVSQTSTGITLRAYDTASVNQYYWASTAANTDSVSPDLTRVVNPVIFPSPIPDNGVVELDYYILDGCDNVASCNEGIRHVTGNLTYAGENTGGVTVEGYGRYNPLNYQFRKYMEDISTTVNVSDVFDYLAFCDLQPMPADTAITTATYSVQPTGYSGSAWVLPEVGIVEFTNASCVHTLTAIVDPELVTDDDKTCTLPVLEETQEILDIEETLNTEWSFSSIKLSTTNIPFPNQ